MQGQLAFGRPNFVNLKLLMFHTFSTLTWKSFVVLRTKVQGGSRRNPCLGAIRYLVAGAFGAVFGAVELEGLGCVAAGAGAAGAGAAMPDDAL